jgi:phosphoribosyl 1,2-cyclic phosphate phosphodiesterase
MHYKMPVLGFRINGFTYITDANFIDEAEFEKIKGSTCLVLNALRREQHISHFTLAEAIAIAEAIQPQQTYFTHISHQLGFHEEVEAELPVGINLAYDMLSIEV